jgi:hypothetical protein
MLFFPERWKRCKCCKEWGSLIVVFTQKKTVNGISRMVRKGSNISELKGIMELVVFIIDLKIT